MDGREVGRVCYLGARSSFKRVKGSAPLRMAITTTMRSAMPAQSIQLVKMLILVFFVLPVVLFSTLIRVPNTAPPPLKSLHEPGTMLKTIHKPHASESQSSILRRLLRDRWCCASLWQFEVMPSFPFHARTMPKAASAETSQEGCTPGAHGRYRAVPECACPPLTPAKGAFS